MEQFGLLPNEKELPSFCLFRMAIDFVLKYITKRQKDTAMLLSRSKLATRSKRAVCRALLLSLTICLSVLLAPARLAFALNGTNHWIEVDGIYSFDPSGYVAGTNVNSNWREDCFDYYGAQLNGLERAIYDTLANVPVPETDNPSEVTVQLHLDTAASDNEVYGAVRNALTACVTDCPRVRAYLNGSLFGVEQVGSNEWKLTLGVWDGWNSYFQQYAEEMVDIIADSAPTTGNRFEIVRYIFNVLENNSKYNPYSSIDGFAPYDQTIIGVFYGKYAVCAGFADATKALCDALGVPCIVVGNAGHAWNFIQMEDGKWYSIDASLSIGEFYEISDLDVGQFILEGRNSPQYAVNSNYTLSDLYIGNPDEPFVFPNLSNDSYSNEFIHDEPIQIAEIPECAPKEALLLYEDNGNGTCTITAIRGGYGSRLNIPDVIDGLAVIAIGPKAFIYRSDLIGELVLPESVVSIGNTAFGFCSGLNGALILPDALINIGNSVFAGCNNLTSVSFPSSLRTIGANAFAGCKSLTGDIILPDNLEDVGSGAFFACTSLDGIFRIPDGIEFSAEIIELCKSIVAFEVGPNSRYTVDDGILYSKDGTKLIACPKGKQGQVNIPDGVQTIGECAFEDCFFISGDLILPDSVETIERFAFSLIGFDSDRGHEGPHTTAPVRTISIPGGVKIGEHAFQLVRFANLEIRGPVTDVDAKAFDFILNYYNPYHNERDYTNITISCQDTKLKELFTSLKEGEYWSQCINIQYTHPAFEDGKCIVCGQCENHEYGGWTTRRVLAQNDEKICPLRISSRTCVTCGYTEWDLFEAGNHTWDEGVEIEGQSGQGLGYCLYTCLACGETKAEFPDGLPDGYVDGGVWGTCPWLISDDGTLVVYPGEGKSQEGSSRSPWLEYDTTITSVVFVEAKGQKVIAPPDSRWLLSGLIYATSIDLTGLDTSKVTNMSCMFGACCSVFSLDLSSLDTSNVEDMSYLFDGCDSLRSLNLSSIDTKNVTSMSGMFLGCTRLLSLTIGPSFVQPIENGQWSAPEGEWVSASDGLTYSGYELAHRSGADTFTRTNYVTTDISVVSAVPIPNQKYTGMAINPGVRLTREGIPLIADIDYIVEYSDNVEVGLATATIFGIGDYSGEITLTFRILPEADCIAIGMWGTCPWEITDDGVLTVHPGEGVTRAIGDDNPRTICPWRSYRGIITAVVFEEMNGRKAIAPKDSDSLLAELNNAVFIDLSGLDTSRANSMRSMFSECSSLTSLDLSGFDTSNVTRMERMFQGCTSLVSVDVSGLDTSNVMAMHLMFQDCSSLTTLDISSFDVSAGPYMDDFLTGCTSLQTLIVSDKYIQPSVEEASDSYLMQFGYGWPDGVWQAESDGMLYAGYAMTHRGVADTYTRVADTFPSSGGWVTVGPDYYYFDAYGTAYVNRWLSSGGSYYYFGADAKLVINGWINSNGTPYYISGAKVATSQWATYEGGRVYLGKDGTITRNGWAADGSTYYYMGADGHPVTNTWAKAGSTYYYMGADGKVATNCLVPADDPTYYVGKDGKVANGWQVVDGAYYYFGSDYTMVKDNWVKYNGYWFYMDANGHPVVNDWITYEGKQYHFNASGVCDRVA